MKKLMILTWFGDEPAWAHRYHQNASLLAEHGFDFLHDRDLDSFRDRVRRILGVDCPIVPGGGKIHDYRPCFGELYADELDGYDWWGHTDYDVVYGRVPAFYPDDALAGCDVQTDNSYDYLCGPWTLYRNTPEVASLFRNHEGWRDQLEEPSTSGWVETSFTEIVRGSCRLWRANHHAFTDPQLLSTDGERLLHGGREVSFYHFRYTKEWPAVPVVA